MQAKNRISKRKTALSVAVFVLAAVLGAWLWARPMLAVPPSGADHTSVRIPRGASEAQIADSLTAAAGESYAKGVVRAWKLLKGSPATAHGSYDITPDLSAYRLAKRLKDGRQSPVKITFNNVRTLDELASRVASRMEFGQEEFLAACDSVLPALGFRSSAEYPAAFIPDTYEAYWSEPAERTLQRLTDERSRFWDESRREEARALGLTPVEVATLASIVEEESAAASERPTIARLYLNRLHRGMPLQADPTVKFAVGDFSLRRITGVHLKTQSAYNTYLHPGLPPGPIRIPEKQTLLAVLSAPEHPYIYMCAKADFSGRHEFTSSYAAHQANAAAYRRALDSRGIK